MSKTYKYRLAVMMIIMSWVTIGSPTMSTIPLITPAQAVPVSIFLKAPEVSELPATSPNSPLPALPKTEQADSGSTAGTKNPGFLIPRLIEEPFTRTIIGYWRQTGFDPLEKAIVKTLITQFFSKIIFAPAQSVMP